MPPDYMVSVNGEAEKPIRAASQSAARNWAVRNAVAVRVMKPEDYISLGRAGGDIIDASGEPDEQNGNAASAQHGRAAAGSGDGQNGAAEPGPSDPATTEDNQTKAETPPAKPSGRGKQDGE